MAKKPARGDQALREENAQIAAAYDRISYDPEATPHVDPAYVRPLATIFGLNPQQNDILDLGCGFGAHTVRASRVANGRVVGLDISAAACRRARERFAQAGREADIRQVDIMDVKAADLGQFDLILCVGAFYIVPEPVRAKMLELMGQCLRPGGACLISFYTGLSGYAAAEVQRLVLAKLGRAQPSPRAVAAARAFLHQMATDFKMLEGDKVVLDRIEHMVGLPDGNLFHELFATQMAALTPKAVHDALKPHGIEIAGIIPYDHAMLGETPDARAIALDILDLMRGGYRYGLFGKWEGKPPPADFDKPTLQWRTGLRRHPDAGPFAYRSPVTGVQVTVHDPYLRAFIDTLNERPRRWREAVEAARRKVAAEQPEPPFDEALLKRDVVWLWQTASVEPGLPELPHPGFD